MRHFIGLGILIFFLSVLPVYAGAPLDTVQTNVNKVLDVLRDPKLKGESAKKIKKEKLEAIYEQMFDEVELSRRTLGANWNKLNPAQQQEFTQLYRQVLEKAYIDKILSYTNEKIVFSKENMLVEQPGRGSDESHHLLKGNPYFLQSDPEGRRLESI